MLIDRGESDRLLIYLLPLDRAVVQRGPLVFLLQAAELQNLVRGTLGPCGVEAGGKELVTAAGGPD